MQCCQCTNNAVVAVNDGKTPLCTEHYLLFMQATSMQTENLERGLNYAADLWGATTGRPSPMPRFPPRQAVHIGSADLRNIHIGDTHVGVLNTGSIRGNVQVVDNAVTALQGSGEQQIAEALQKLTEATLANQELLIEQKSEAIEILRFLSLQMATPEEHRQSSIAKMLTARLSDLLHTSGSLASLWGVFGPVLVNALGGPP